MKQHIRKAFLGLYTDITLDLYNLAHDAIYLPNGTTVLDLDRYKEYIEACDKYLNVKPEDNKKIALLALGKFIGVLYNIVVKRLDEVKRDVQKITDELCDPYFKLGHVNLFFSILTQELCDYNRRQDAATKKPEISTIIPLFRSQLESITNANQYQDSGQNSNTDNDSDSDVEDIYIDDKVANPVTSISSTAIPFYQSKSMKNNTLEIKTPNLYAKNEDSEDDETYYSLTWNNVDSDSDSEKNNNSKIKGTSFFSNSKDNKHTQSMTNIFKPITQS